MATDIKEAVLEDTKIDSKYKVKFGDSVQELDWGTSKTVELMRAPTAEEVQTLLDLQGASMCSVEEVTTHARLYKYNNGWN
ncbi:hypothetical protein KAMFAM_198 [Bacillus phage Kamfam]|nr:hypothetical protein OTK52_196 [Bacillus phage OTooleKemple52]AXQ67145.1 hypothetical protein KAMFAM_198 [Bacillus phage Kamfam]